MKMNRVVRFGSLLALTVTLIAVPATAEQEGNFWQGLQSKLEKITPQRKAPVTTAVGGVRGSKDQSADSLYWKGEEALPIGEDELRRFQEAVQAATAGNRQAATDQFAAFLNDYPRSALREDAQLALKALESAATDGTK